MTNEELVMKALAEVAPELDEATLDRKAPLREQLDLDSIDFLRFVVALSKLFGADIPERDYARLSSVAQCAQYVGEAQATRANTTT